jgi:hypothetical protein
MKAATKLRSHSLMRCAAPLVVAGALLSAVSYGWPGQNRAEKVQGTNKSEKIAREIEEVRQDKEMAMYDVEQLAEAGAVEAIPALEEKFARMPGSPSRYPSWDAADKAHVASALVRLGDKKQIYWDYLIKQATEAVNSDAPDPASYDSKGKPLPGVSPEFQAWADAHKLPHAGLWDMFRYVLPGPVLLLGMTGDPRAVPVLRRGLLSPNYIVESSSAKGLAQVGDKASVPLIIEACKKAPPDAASVITRSLVYFDDPEAQKAVDRYVPKEIAKALREEKARGKKKPLP